MDPHAEKTPGLALPTPSTEPGMVQAGVFTDGGIKQREAFMPITEVRPGGASTPQFSMPASPSVGQQQYVVPTVAPAIPSTATPSASSATSDDDTSTLDEEWVNKAKAIVDQTRSDPYLESKELGRAKADYLRIRYNKHIKVADEQTR